MTEPYEDYEEWPDFDSVHLFAFVPADLDFADFDTATSEAHEDFEEEWDSNEDYDWTLPSVGAATFGTGFAATGDTETFEGAKFDMTGVTFNPATAVWTKTSHGLSDSPSWVVTLLNSGGRLPDGYLLETEYYVETVTTDTFQLASVDGGAAVDGTDTGYGTHGVKHHLIWFWTEELTGV
jgi:hypothetical protein